MSDWNLIENANKEYYRIEPDGTIVVAEWLVIMSVESRKALLRVARGAKALREVWGHGIGDYGFPIELEEALKEVKHLLS